MGLSSSLLRDATTRSNRTSYGFIPSCVLRVDKREISAADARKCVVSGYERERERERTKAKREQREIGIKRSAKRELAAIESRNDRVGAGQLSKD